MNTEEILTQIDGALNDWEVGPDAMRCNAPDDVSQIFIKPGSWIMENHSRRTEQDFRRDRMLLWYPIVLEPQSFACCNPA